MEEDPEQKPQPIIHQITENKEESKNIETIILTRKNRCFIFSLIVTLNILVNMDNGSIPAATNEIAEYLEIDKATIGLYGSLAFFGVLLGSFISMPLINLKNRKAILIFTLTFNFLVTFGLAIKNKYVGAILRILVGISQSFLAIYSPVWVDQFGNKKYKTVMLALQQLSGPLGIVSGYILTFLVKKHMMWYWGVLIQGILISICVFILIFTNKKYFSNDLFIYTENNILNVSNNLCDNQNIMENNNLNNIKNINSEENKNNNISNFKPKSNEDRIKHDVLSNGRVSVKKIQKKTNKIFEEKFNKIKFEIELENKDFILQNNIVENNDINNLSNNVSNIISNNINNNIKNDVNNNHINNYIITDNDIIRFKNNINQENSEIPENNINNNQMNGIYFINDINLNNNNLEIENKIQYDFSRLNSSNNLKPLVKDLDEISVFRHMKISGILSVKEKIKIFFFNMKKIIKIKVYIFAVIAVSILNFISTAIQYWVSDHLKKVMKFDEDSIFICFIITCVSAPALGVIGGGYIVQKYGGYESKKSIVFCFVFSMIAGLDAIAIVFQDQLVGFTIVLWIFLFFGGAIIPNLIGIFISSLPRELRAFGNSFSTILITLLGQLPAPYIYGAIYNIDETKKTAFNSTMLYSWGGVFFIGLTLIFRMKDPKPETENIITNKIHIEKEEIKFDIVSDLILPKFENFDNIKISTKKMKTTPIQINKLKKKFTELEQEEKNFNTSYLNNEGKDIKFNGVQMIYNISSVCNDRDNLENIEDSPNQIKENEEIKKKNSYENEQLLILNKNKTYEGNRNSRKQDKKNYSDEKEEKNENSLTSKKNSFKNFDFRNVRKNFHS